MSPKTDLPISQNQSTPDEINALILAALKESTSLQAPTSRHTWLDKLRSGLRKTGTGISTVFTGVKVDDALYDELESALLMADAG